MFWLAFKDPNYGDCPSDSRTPRLGGAAAVAFLKVGFTTQSPYHSPINGDTAPRRTVCPGFFELTTVGGGLLDHELRFCR